MVYLSKPQELQKKEFTKIKTAENKLTQKFVTLAEVCSEITGKQY